LGRAYRIDQRLAAKAARLENLRDLSTRISAAVPGSIRSGQPAGDRMSGIIATIADLEAEIQGEVEALLATQRETAALIRSVGRPEWQTVLELRYLCFKRWETIAEEMGVTHRQVFYLHKQALAAVGNGRKEG
jgi:DNA-directed RNA polymerase specialized sigma subunit